MSDAHHRLMPPNYKGGGIIIAETMKVNMYKTKRYQIRSEWTQLKERTCTLLTYLLTYLLIHFIHLSWKPNEDMNTTSSHRAGLRQALESSYLYSVLHILTVIDGKLESVGGANLRKGS